MKTALIIASLVVLGGSLGVIFASSREPKAAVSLGPAPKPNPVASTTGADTTLPAPASLEVWFARGEKLVSVRRTHEATPRVATAAIGALLEGPPGPKPRRASRARSPTAHVCSESRSTAESRRSTSPRSTSPASALSRCRSASARLSTR